MTIDFSKFFSKEFSKDFINPGEAYYRRVSDLQSLLRQSGLDVCPIYEKAEHGECPRPQYLAVRPQRLEEVSSLEFSGMMLPLKWSKIVEIACASVERDNVFDFPIK